MLDLFYLVILLPLLGFLHNGLLSKKLGARVTGTVGTLAVFVPFLIALGSFLEFNVLERNDPHLFTLLPWIQLGSFSVDFGYQVDQLSLYMTLIITGIGSLIHLYSVGYMKKDPGFNRFFAYLNLFVFSMLNLVLSDNLVLTFLGWEGVGLCSYLLIGFEFEKETAANAGMKAFVVNRIGDLGFIIGMGMVYWFTGTLKYTEINALLPGIQEFQNFTNIVAIAFFIAAVGKSAQIPLYFWLPDAMAGPTPVSALIHAATMVTAGIFLIARLNIIYLNAELASIGIALIGATTAFFAATIAIFQNDIKKVLAYSTVSQLGYMFLAMGVGAYVGGLFHLMTHAFFKALLFLGAGSVIHALHHEQDLLYMGGLKKYMKITFLTFAIGTLAISGIPPFSGFFSKDLILEKAYSFQTFGPGLWVLGALTALMTSFYMFRLFFLTFLGKERIQPEAKKHLHESPATMTFPLVVLAIGAATAGFLQTPFFAGGIDTLNQYFRPILQPGIALQAQWETPLSLHALDHSMEVLLAGISVGLAVVGLFFAMRLLGRDKPVMAEYSGWKQVLANKYYVDEFYDAVFVKNFERMTKFIAYQLDRGVIDRFFLVVGFGFGGFTGVLRRIQTGFVGDYALYIVLGTIAILAFVLVRGV